MYDIVWQAIDIITLLKRKISSCAQVSKDTTFVYGGSLGIIINSCMTSNLNVGNSARFSVILEWF